MKSIVLGNHFLSTGKGSVRHSHLQRLQSNFLLKNEIFEKSKYMTDINDNQRYLLEAINKLCKSESFFLLDGYLCLLNSDSIVQHIKLQTILVLKPDSLVLLTDSPRLIVESRILRDGIECNLSEINVFQNEEIAYTNELSGLLYIPLLISRGKKDIDNTLMLIKI